jgi:hypothetical protein
MRNVDRHCKDFEWFDNTVIVVRAIPLQWTNLLASTMKCHRGRTGLGRSLADHDEGSVTPTIHPE